MTPSPESPDKHHGDADGWHGRALAAGRRTWQTHWRLILSWAGVVVLLVAVATMAEFEALCDRLGGYGPPASSMILSSPVPWRPLLPN